MDYDSNLEESFSAPKNDTMEMDRISEGYNNQISFLNNGTAQPQITDSEVGMSSPPDSKRDVGLDLSLDDIIASSSHQKKGTRQISDRDRGNGKSKYLDMPLNDITKMTHHNDRQPYQDRRHHDRRQQQISQRVMTQGKPQRQPSRHGGIQPPSIYHYPVTHAHDWNGHYSYSLGAQPVVDQPIHHHIVPGPPGLRSGQLPSSNNLHPAVHPIAPPLYSRVMERNRAPHLSVEDSALVQTVLDNQPTELVVKLKQTNIVKINKQNGDVTLSSGGHRTALTFAALNVALHPIGMEVTEVSPGAKEWQVGDHKAYLETFTDEMVIRGGGVPRAQLVARASVLQQYLTQKKTTAATKHQASASARPSQYAVKRKPLSVKPRQ